jgi:hypothetical protein
MNIFITRIVREAIFSLGILSMLSVLVSGCSKSVPSCDDGKSIKAVVFSVSQDMKKQLSGIAGVQPGMELSDDEWRLIRSGMIIDLENIREQNFDKDTGKRMCAANLMIQSGGKKDLIPITYAEELDPGTGEVKVVVSGFEEYNKSKAQPEAKGEEE